MQPILDERHKHIGRLHDHHARQHASDVADAADHEHRPEHKGLRGEHVVGAGKTHVARIQKAADRGDCGTTHDGAGLERLEVVAHAGGELRFFAHQAQRAAKAAVAKARAHPGGDAQHDQHQRQKRDAVPGPSQSFEQRGNRADAVGTTGQPTFVGGHGAQNFRDRGRGNAPVIGGQLAAHAGEEQAQQHGQCNAHGEAGQQRPAEAVANAGGIGTETGEGDVAEVEQTGVARLNVQTQGHQAVDARNGERRDQKIKHGAPPGRTGHKGGRAGPAAESRTMRR